MIYFHQGEDYKGLTASLWTRILCLLRLNRSREAIFAYGQLQKIAIEQIGESAAQKFAADLENEIYPIRGLSLKSEILELEKSLITRALKKTNGGKVKAAEILKLRNHQALSVALAERHPYLYEELGFRQRAHRGSAKSSKVAKLKKISREVSRTYENPSILQIDTKETKLTYEFRLPPGKFNTYYLDETIMQSLAVSGDALVLLLTNPQLQTGMKILVLHENQLTVTQVQYEEGFDLFVIYDEHDVPIFLDDENILGVPIGYCLFDDFTQEEIRFLKMI